MIPQSIEDWTLETIKTIAQKGIFENEYFDFKEKLPHSKNTNDKERMFKTCAAFANSNGGFLIFGVKDDKGLSVEDRLVGIDLNLDFPEQFGNYPAKCEPSVDWDFLNPPLKLENDNVIHVVHIKAGWQKPSGFSKDDVWYFPKRTNKGTEFMSYQEIRDMFLNYEEKRNKLMMFIHEIQTIYFLANHNITRIKKQSYEKPPPSFDTSILTNIFPDISSVLIEDQSITTYFIDLRLVVNSFNSTRNLYDQTLIRYGLSAVEQVQSDYFDEFLKLSEKILELCIELHDRIYSIAKIGFEEGLK